MNRDIPDRPDQPEEAQEPDGIETCHCGDIIIVDDTDVVRHYIEVFNLDICCCGGGQ